MNGDLDWNLVRAFAAVAERGSLSGAARALGRSQPTLGRHIAQLEEALGVDLFVRHARGLSLTTRGSALYATARQASDALDGFMREATGHSEALAGTVRISASETVAHYVLPRLLAPIIAEHPEIELEIVATNAVSNLLRRDADVAVRMTQPAQPDLIGRKVGAAQMRLYATEAYLRRRGVPTLDTLTEHSIIGLDRDTLHLKTLSSAGLAPQREDFTIRTDNQPLHVALARAGCGVAGLQQAIAQQFAELRPVLPALLLPDLPVWLVAHAEVRRSARVRRVFDGLAEGLQAFYA